MSHDAICNIVAFLHDHATMSNPSASPITVAPKPRLSIVMPVRNEAAGLNSALLALLPLLQRGAELIVVDGASSDDTLRVAQAFGNQRAAMVLSSAPGRALQMNAGARQARGEVLLFLHADTSLPAAADLLIDRALASGACVWGRFDVVIIGRSRWLKVIATTMNWRSRLSGIATGDQAMFVTRTAFERVGCFAEQALMEDIDLSARLKRVSAPACLRERVCTSGRRWDSRGACRTIALMWGLRLAYWLGVSPRRLVLWYR